MRIESLGFHVNHVGDTVLIVALNERYAVGFDLSEHVPVIWARQYGDAAEITLPRWRGMGDDEPSDEGLVVDHSSEYIINTDALTGYHPEYKQQILDTAAKIEIFRGERSQP